MKNINVFEYTNNYRGYTRQYHIRNSHIVLSIGKNRGEFSMNLK